MWWPKNIVFARGGVLLVALAQLFFAWWYLRGWFWLPKSSLRRLGGWTLVFIFNVVVPVAIYRANVERGHRDSTVSLVLMLQATFLIALIFYAVRKKRPGHNASL